MITPAERACLGAIRRLTVDGVTPSMEELRAELGLASKGTVHRILHQLAGAGVICIERRRGRARSTITFPGDPISPAALEVLSDAALRTTMATIAGILARREGDYAPQTIAAIDRIADRLARRAAA